MIDAYGRSPLHYAALEGDVVVVRTLVAEGFDVAASDREARTPLHFAAQGQHADVARSLLDGGAPVDARDDHGNTPLSDALFNVRDGEGAVIGVLLAAGADQEAANHAGVSPRALAESVANYDLMRFLR